MMKADDVRGELEHARHEGSKACKAGQKQFPPPIKQYGKTHKLYLWHFMVVGTFRIFYKLEPIRDSYYYYTLSKF